MKGEVKIIGDGLLDTSLLPCEATGSLEFDVNSISILRVHRGAKKFMVGTANAMGFQKKRAFPFSCCSVIKMWHLLWQIWSFLVTAGSWFN